jgi:putative heme transporter
VSVVLRDPAAADAAGAGTAPGGVAPLPAPWGRRPWRLVLGVAVVALLGVEVALGAPLLGGALAALRQAQLGWVVVAVVAEAASMDLFARLRRRLLAAAGVRVRMRDALAAVYVANSVHLTLPGGAAFSTAYTYRWLREREAGAVTGTWVLVAGGLIATSSLAALALAGSLLVGASAGVPALAVDVVSVVALVAAGHALRRRPDLPLLAGRRLLRGFNRLLRRPPARGVDTLEGLVLQLQAVRPSVRDWAVATTYGLGNWLSTPCAWPSPWPPWAPRCTSPRC